MGFSLLWGNARKLNCQACEMEMIFFFVWSFHFLVDFDSISAGSDHNLCHRNGNLSSGTMLEGLQ